MNKNFEQRKLTIPSDSAYYDSGLGDIIPDGATLIIDEKLIEIIATMYRNKKNEVFRGFSDTYPETYFKSQIFTR